MARRSRIPTFLDETLLPPSVLRGRRYVLVCRWFVASATGKLECRWQIEPVVKSPAEAPAPRWLKGDRPRGSAVSLHAETHLHGMCRWLILE